MARTMLNGLPPLEASRVTGLSVHMLNYLARQGYLKPAHAGTGKRGSRRYYSFRDLVIARIVAQFLQAGLEISRLKSGINRLSADPAWAADPDKLRYLATDGSSLFIVGKNGKLDDLTAGGQLAFAFLLDIQKAKKDVKRLLPEHQRKEFSMKLEPLKFLVDGS